MEHPIDDTLVYLAATIEQRSKTQSDRDVVRLKHAVSRVQKEIDDAFGRMDKMRIVLVKSWNLGEVLGNAAARRQCSALKLDKPKATQADKDYYKSFLQDMRRILADEDTPQTRLRASMCVEAAVKYAFHSSYCDIMRNTPTKKMWKTTSIVPCSHCKHLDGTVLPWDEEFPINVSSLKPLKAYKDTLLHPARHPNCRCVLIPVPDNIGNTEG